MSKATENTLNKKKFEALVHYIIKECSDPRRLGAIRLNKVLWFADVIMYQIEGASIAGETYVKRQHGPVPRHILRTLESLEAAEAIMIVEPQYKFDTRQFISRTSPRSDLLSQQERDVVKVVLDDLLGRSAGAVSEISHDQVWATAMEGETIPLCATLVAEPLGIRSDVREWAEQVVQVAA